MSIPAALEEILVDFREQEDFQVRADLLIELADEFVEVPSDFAKRPFPKENLVPGCESEAFAFAKKISPDSLHFYFAIENPQGISAKAMSVILDKGLSGQSKEEILEVNEEIVYEIFGQNITMGRGRGLMSMVAMVKSFARAKLGNLE